MKTLLNIQVSDTEFNRLVSEQEQGKELFVENGKVYARAASYYIAKSGKLVIDEVRKAELEKKEAIKAIDFQLDELEKDLLHNETYKYDDDYQATKDDILVKIKNLRNDREVLKNAK